MSLGLCYLPTYSLSLLFRTVIDYEDSTPRKVIPNLLFGKDGPQSGKGL